MKLRHSLLRIASLLLFVSLLCNIAVAEQIVEEIRINGNKRVDDETILVQVATEVGSAFHPKLVDSDVKEIFRTGP